MIFVPSTASLFSLLAIAIDRYIFITKCLRYHTIVTLTRTKIVIAIVWGIALLNAVAIAMPWTYPSASERIYCTCMIVEASSDLYISIYSILFNIIPILIILSLYCVIVNAAVDTHKRKLTIKAIRRTKMDAKSLTSPTRHTAITKNNSIWKKKGIPTLGALVASVTLLLLPISCGMLSFVVHQNVTYVLYHWKFLRKFILWR